MSNNSQNILIRADSSSEIGTGHIMRDLVLAQQYPNDNIIFATKDLNGNINQKVEESGYKIITLQTNEFDELNDIIEKNCIHMIIIDHYGIDYKFEKKLKEKNPNLKLFVLDDTYEKHYCDILLNHNINGDKKKYKDLVPKHCELRCGSKYTLLRDEFIKAKKQKNIIKKDKINKTIFVAMGGSDHKNLNIDILKVLNKIRKKNKQNLKVNIVTTNANKNLEKLIDYCKNKKWIKLYINSNKIAKLMISSDLAVVTPSVTVNEVYFLKLPFISIKTADNQKEIHRYLRSNKFLTLKEFNNKKLRKIIKRELVKI